jgi:alpha-tubulin suppressor-like RCC1 family protein
VSGGVLAYKTVTDITAGAYHTCALISDGTVTCWGYNSYGQLGDGSNTNRNVPVAVTGGALTGKTVTDITAGVAHTCALISDGTVTCWGNNVYGRLGTGDDTNRNVPVAVTGGALANKTVTDITASLIHTCALISDGTVTCWGYNSYGQLGDGSNTDSNVPVAVTGGVLANKTVIDITAGTYHACALISDGTVACWGNNSAGQLGDGSNTNRNVPVAVAGGALSGKTVTHITAGDYHTCALISNGTVTCWGDNSAGQLGDGGTTASNVPVAVAVAGGVLANRTVTNITTGGYHTCALISDGTVTCWGLNASGQLGTGDTYNRTVPVAVAGGALANKTVTDITAGRSHTCALISDGTVTCWGENSNGQLGDGGTTASNVPLAIFVLDNKNVTDITGGFGHSCALILNGTATCWGYNGDGQLGNGTTTNSNTPVDVFMLFELTGKTVTHITGGDYQTCAVLSDGTAACWGYNVDGQLGTGDNTDRNVPVAVVWLRNIVAPTVSGTVEVGATLSANKGTWTGYSAPTFAYQWYACTQQVSSATQTVPETCATINAATQTTYTLTSTHLGKYITVKVTGTSAGTDPVSWLSVSTSTEVLTQTAATTKPTLTGAAKVGATLTANKGTWTGSSSPTLTYQWYACTQKVSSATQTVPGTCATINAATQTTLTLTSTHKGKYIAVKVTGTSSGTDPVSWLSVSTSTKVLMRAAVTTKPTLTGTAKVGKTLTANKGTWTGSPAPTFTYQWYACTQQVSSATQTVPGTCVAINAATQPTLKLTSVHKGKYITVKVTGTSSGTPKTLWLAKTTTKVS